MVQFLFFLFYACGCLVSPAPFIEETVLYPSLLYILVSLVLLFGSFVANYYIYEFASGFSVLFQ